MPSMVLRAAPVLILVLAGVGAGASAAGCSNGTTPVCDDAGSCLISPAGDGGVVEASGSSGGEEEGDAPAE
jgi:hypothetical protein